MNFITPQISTSFEIIFKINMSLLLRAIISRHFYNYKQTNTREAYLCFDKNVRDKKWCKRPQQRLANDVIKEKKRWLPI